MNITMNTIADLESTELMNLQNAALVLRLYDAVVAEAPAEEIQKLEGQASPELVKLFDQVEDILKVLNVSVPEERNPQAEIFYKAAEMILQGEGTPTKLADMVCQVVKEHEFCAQLRKAIHRFEKATEEQKEADEDSKEN